MKILYLIDTLYNSGGMERVLSEKANYLVAHYGYEILIATTHQKGRKEFFPLDARIKREDLGVNTHLPFTMPCYLKRLKGLLQKERPDILISLCSKELKHFDKIDFEGIKLAEFHFSYESLRIRGKNRELKNLQKAVAGLDAFVTLTQEDQIQWVPYAPHIYQIYNPSTYDGETQSAALEKPICISGGRFEKQKNYADMVKAWAYVHQKHPDWQLSLYGNGRKKKEIATLVKELGLESAIQLHPATSQIKDKMLDSSLYLMTSLYEGLPLTLIESCSLGLPAISYNCPCGPSEIIENGQSGYLIPQGDIEGLAEKICQLIENEKLRKEMGKKAKEKAAQFGKARIMEQWHQLFEQLYKTKMEGRK